MRFCDIAATTIWLLARGFSSLVVLAMPIWLAPFGAGYPDLMQKFAIYGDLRHRLQHPVRADRLSLLRPRRLPRRRLLRRGLVVQAPDHERHPGDHLRGDRRPGLFALVIGYLSLRRSGIYFSILTLAFAQMSYNLAYSVLTPITNGETGLQLTLNDPRILDAPVQRAPDSRACRAPSTCSASTLQRLRRLLLLRACC